jgi:hypothetical protein
VRSREAHKLKTVSQNVRSILKHYRRPGKRGQHKQITAHSPKTAEQQALLSE